MRTTVEFDADTAKAVEALRRERGLGVSEAVNELVRRGLAVEQAAPPYRSEPRHLGIRIDVSNLADALDLLEGAQAR